MTAEVVVMNTGAVAMAADSAVTIGPGKVFYGANKVFALSKRHPVGVMVYGNAALMGIPWETLIKLFRAELGDQAYGTLAEYAEALVAFVAQRTDLYPPETQDEYVRRRLRAFYEGYIAPRVLNLAMNLQDETMEATGSLTVSDRDASYADAITRVIQDQADTVAQLENDVALSEPDRADLHAVVEAIVSELKDLYFGEQGLSDEQEQQLVEIFVTAVLIQAPPACASHCSGLMIAGYGDEDVFPRARHFAIWGVFRGQLLSVDLSGGLEDISADNPACVIPAAQRDVVDTLIEGVDPDYKRMASEATSAMVRAMVDGVTDAMAEHIEDTNEFREQLSELMATQLVDLDEALTSYRRQEQVAPFLAAVSGLPKEELAEIAENLVSLTAIRRKISTHEETVGGPVDVAVMSKGDGFVWVKRKHYFPGELNPQFFANYNRGAGDGPNAAKVD